MSANHCPTCTCPTTRTLTVPLVHGRFRIFHRERVAAVRARIAADNTRGATTPPGIIALAEEDEE